ncbi:HAD family phosphatase [Vibrio sp. JPW-9-11-11]|uniref:HAD family hydrolase n=1 Tax=Vibrio sp. JPW-9-11-11 TaxID=1416532 RepID=UPI001592CD2E|nr:HAD family phosphatase [Vibrio sp. JPW-9-11-11]NVD06489.1 HAD family phosphatase [Vibrio sp. JPW-9-11-11]
MIKSVVFDVGNVIVRWAPLEIVRLTFGEVDQPETLAKQVFTGEIWLDLNRGLLTEQEAKLRYQQELYFTEEQSHRLFYYVKHTLIQLYGSVELMKKLKASGYALYALTDNVIELVDFLKQNYDFWPLFDGATVSADLGLLKPQPEIYQSLLASNNLDAQECVFLDDMPHNVEGAKRVGMQAIQFFSAEQAEQDLRALGLKI